MLKHLFLISCFISFLLPALSGADYYVTQTGAGNHSGTSSGNAWSVSEYNASSTPTGGDVVHFTGTITSTVVPNTNGKGDGQSRLTLDFSSATLNSAIPRISLKSRSYLNINGGTLGSASSGSLITFNNAVSHHITIQNWKFTGTTTSVVRFVHGAFVHNFVMSGNTIDNATLFWGDTINLHDITIANNYCRTSLNTTAQTDIISMGDAYNVTIEGNKLIQRTEGAITERHNDAIQCYQKGGSNAGSPHNWIVRYNWIEVSVATGSGDTSWMMMEAMSGDPAIKIYGNVFYGNPSGGRSNNGINLKANASSTTVYFFNNTIIRKNKPDNTMRFREPGILHAYNNLGYADADETGTFFVWTMSAGSTWDNNFFYNFDGCSSVHRGAHGSCTANPQLVDYANDKFALSESSPLIGAGRALGAEYSKGIAEDATWPAPALVNRNTWDIGAFVGRSKTATVSDPKNLRIVQ